MVGTQRRMAECPPQPACELPEELWKEKPGPWEVENGEEAKGKWKAVRIRQFLNKVTDALQKEKACDSKSAAVKALEDSLKTIEKEYAGILKVIQEYETAYNENFKAQAAELDKKCEELKGKFQGDCKLTQKLQTFIRKTIKADYQQRETELKEQFDLAECELKNAVGKSKVERSKEEQEEEAKKFEGIKNRKSEIERWLKELSDLYNQALDYLNKSHQYKAAFATSLEFCELVKPKTPDRKTNFKNEVTLPNDFENELTEALRNWIKASHARFLYHQEHLKAKTAYDNANETYEAFKKNRRKNFIEEVQFLSEEDAPKQECGADEESV